MVRVRGDRRGYQWSKLVARPLSVSFLPSLRSRQIHSQRVDLNSRQLDVPEMSKAELNEPHSDLTILRRIGGDGLHRWIRICPLPGRSNRSIGHLHVDCFARSQTARSLWGSFLQKAETYPTHRGSGVRPHD